MQIKIVREANVYALTSTITNDELALVKKYRPAALRVKDADGNDIFAMSYTEGRPSITNFGITFGSVNANGNLVVTGTFPSDCKPGDYVADLVSASLGYIAQLEEAIPAAAAEIKASRDALLSTIVEA